jgi:hypothetical protein
VFVLCPVRCKSSGNEVHGQEHKIAGIGWAV